MLHLSFKEGQEASFLTCFNKSLVFLQLKLLYAICIVCRFVNGIISINGRIKIVENYRHKRISPLNVLDMFSIISIIEFSLIYRWDSC